jgi:chaperonin GroES
MPKLKPLGDHVIVKPSKPEEVTKSGIILPSNSNEKPEQGEVIAVGPGKVNEKGERVAMDIKVGDKVVFKKYAPDEIKIDNEEVYVMSQDDIVAVIE